jgi:hypothetical protein
MIGQQLSSLCPRLRALQQKQACAALLASTGGTPAGLTQNHRVAFRKRRIAVEKSRPRHASVMEEFIGKVHQRVAVPAETPLGANEGNLEAPSDSQQTGGGRARLWTRL